MEENDQTTVRVTVHKHHETEYIKCLRVEPDDRDQLANPEFVDLTFHTWNQPGCDQFHFEGIPFVGFHDHGESYEPHRMCGDGRKCMEIAANRDERLCILADEVTGLCELQSSIAVREFLTFEQACRNRMKLVGCAVIV